jgi:hypothetical protein
MKHTIAIIALFSLISLSAQAQITATWKGGTPGKTTDWNCPTNWEEGRVPNEYSNVIIPDVSTSTFSYPMIDNDVEILSHSCTAPALLKIRNNAQVIVLESALNEQSVWSDSFAQGDQRKDRL